MEISTLWAPIEKLWPVVVLFTVLVLFLIKIVNKSFDNNLKIAESIEKNNLKIVESLEKISYNIGRKVLNNSETVLVFKAIMSEHIQRKIEVCNDILVENNIFKRQPEIREIIHNQFWNITEEESAKLSKFNSSAWDLWQILINNLKFDEFIEKVCEKMFTTLEKDKKLKDIRNLMNWYVNKLIKIIQQETKKNWFNF